MTRSEYERLVSQGEPPPPAGKPEPSKWAKGCLCVLLALAVVVVAGKLILHLLAGQLVDAPRFACLANLSSIHLAAWSWAEANHTNQLPTDFSTFTNRMREPSLLHCPWDFAHTNLATWSALSVSNTSYVVATNGARLDSTNPYVICTWHQFAIMGNGELSHDKKGQPRRIRP